MAIAPHPLFSRLTALVIDDQSAMRTLHRNQLLDIGLGEVEVATGPTEALARLAKRAFDVILCDHDLRSHTDGQQLLEALRNDGILPASTIFIMITGNGFRGDVAAVSEHLPDDYVLKPISVRGLEERLLSVLRRRAALNPVLQKIRANDLEGAVQLCDDMLASDFEYPLDLMRRKAECLVEAGKPSPARVVYEQVSNSHAHLVWPKMGKARTYLLEGQEEAARTLLVSLVRTNDQNIGAYDLLALLEEKSGRPDESEKVLRAAVQKVGSASRHRALGHMAARTGKLEVARASLKQAFKLTSGSAAAQVDDALMLAQVHVDLRDPTAAHYVLDEAASLIQDTPSARRAFSAVRSQALREQGRHDAADRELALALDGADANGSAQSLIISKAALRARDQVNRKQGLKFLQKSLQQGQAGQRVAALARQVLVDTGHQDSVSEIVDLRDDGLRQEIARSKVLLRERQFSVATKQLEGLLAANPCNTVLLLETTRAHLLGMSIVAVHDQSIARVEELLSSLDRLIPGSEKVRLLHEFLARVLAKDREAAA